jgi:hypothetical protein
VFVLYSNKLELINKALSVLLDNFFLLFSSCFFPYSAFLPLVRELHSKKGASISISSSSLHSSTLA